MKRLNILTITKPWLFATIVATIIAVAAGSAHAAPKLTPTYVAQTALAHWNKTTFVAPNPSRVGLVGCTQTGQPTGTFVCWYQLTRTNSPGVGLGPGFPKHYWKITVTSGAWTYAPCATPTCGPTNSVGGPLTSG